MGEPGDIRGTPLIAVTGRRRSARGLVAGAPYLDELEAEVFFTGYGDHLDAAGGLAVHVASRTNVDALLDRMDGLVLTGGADVDPARYGVVADSMTPPLTPERDELELELLDAALARGLPVLAICRGVQLVNVGRGGTLHTHLEHHPVGPWHEVLVEPGSILETLYGATTTVNSFHHQSVDRLGADLVVTARALDGVVEGIELPGVDLLGVQWHPEQMTGTQPVFDWIVEAARQRAGIRGTHRPTS